MVDSVSKMEPNFIEKMLTLCQQIEILGTQYAEAKAQSWHLQELKRVMLAHAMTQYESLPVSQRELKALVSETYKTHLDGTTAAIHREHQTKAQLERAHAEFEAWRSLCSLEKAKMNLV